MFKNRDGSYNKGSITISLFILLVTLVMIFSYIGANVALPTLNLTQENSIISSSTQIPITPNWVDINYTNTTPFNFSYTNYTKAQWVDINSSVTIIKYNTTYDETWLYPDNTSTVNYIVVGGGGGGYISSQITRINVTSGATPLPLISNYARNVSFSYNITAGMGTQTDYQMKFILSNSSGISGYYAPDNVIYTNGTTRADWNDVNATDGSNNPLNFWIENNTYTSKNATAWVKVPSIAVGNTSTGKWFYGNSSQSVSSMNGATTFLMFDDFSQTINYVVGGGGGAGSTQTNYTHIETNITTPVTFPSLVQTSPLDSIFSPTIQTIAFFGWLWIVFRLINK